MKDTTTVKALERIVKALIADADEELTRLDMIEEALSYASLVLGMTPPDQKALRDQLDTVAAQILADKIEREGLKVFQAVLTCEHDEHLATVVAVSDPDLAHTINKMVERFVEKTNKPNPNYSVN